MAVAELDEKTYGRLIVRSLPKIIKSDVENERRIAELERLDTSGRTLTPEQQALAD